MSWRRLGRVPIEFLWHPDESRTGPCDISIGSWRCLSRVPTTSRPSTNKVSIESRRHLNCVPIGSWRWPSEFSTEADGDVVVVQRFENKKLKLGKWFTKLKNQTHFQNYKSFFGETENIFSLTIIFNHIKYQKIRRKYFTPK
jgi:hypothetical protein